MTLLICVTETCGNSISCSFKSAHLNPEVFRSDLSSTIKCDQNHISFVNLATTKAEAKQEQNKPASAHHSKKEYSEVASLVYFYFLSMVKTGLR